MSRCTSCGLIHRPGRCNPQTSAAPPDVPMDISPRCCCICYFSVFGSFFLLFLLYLFLNKLDAGQLCYVELFANSVSVSYANANVSTADWKIGFVAKSPITGCKVSIHTLNSRLVRSGEVVSKSSSPSSSYFIPGDNTEVVFEKVVTPAVVGDVIWDSQAEIMFGINTDVKHLHGILLVACSNIPVKFTTEQATEEVVGSLLGNMRRCDYIYQQSLA
ncbi:uncharacterized protein LOC111829902 isoform X1 [Capsella rubella]|uniref:uncharacterized protein LOC111829902 isoform X1 n=1 Tax=Capsella rubella TaxID=81985 RepID=UPI000CD4DFF1|nr:uncharacterized protein LOC111829902 isoform X1 [Capsella rubella]XP_023635703.1 uncharacterized protein LOC111829902 isoform X1 [Capsella rubella]